VAKGYREVKGENSMKSQIDTLIVFF